MEKSRELCNGPKSMTFAEERRRHPRKIGDGLIVIIGGHGHSLVDISIGGLSFQSNGYKKGDRIRLKLARLTDMTDCVNCKITVVETTDVVTRVKFRADIRVMSYIVRHIGEVTGVSPFYFR